VDPLVKYAVRLPPIKTETVFLSQFQLAAIDLNRHLNLSAIKWWPFGERPLPGGPNSVKEAHSLDMTVLRDKVDYLT
jgi:hypothetical protein